MLNFRCPACDHPNPAGTSDCTQCGQGLPHVEPARRPQRRRPPPGRRRRPPPRAERTLRQRRRPPTRRPPPRRAGPPPSRVRRPESKVTMPPGESSQVVAWLCCDPMPPIPLGHTPILTIGRDAACALTLPHKQVSRTHAVIKVRGATMHLTDEGSSNGTWVNGRRMTTAPLQVGDSLTIGPYELEIVSTTDLLARAEQDVSHSTTNVMQQVRKQDAMSGRIEEVSVPELLQQLEFNAKSGTLVIEGEAEAGQLVVRAGQPLTARFGAATGEEAIIAMTALSAGSFTLRSSLPSGVGERRIDRTLTAILFEASRRHDESAGYAYGADDPATGTSHGEDEETDAAPFSDTKDWERFWKN